MREVIGDDVLACALDRLHIKLGMEAGWMTMEEVDAGWPEVTWEN